MNELAYWITERESIRLKRLAGEPAPWSEDPVFQTRHFCNVHREHDRGTIEIAKVWRTPHQESPYLPAIVGVARMFNYAPTLELIGDPMSYWVNKLKLEHERGAKLFHTAYVVSTNGEEVGKVDYVWRIFGVLKEMCEKHWHHNYRTMSDFHSTIMTVRGFGSFMAAQVVADVKHTRWPWTLGVTDGITFAAPGPGSLRGATKVLGRSVTEARFMPALEEIREGLGDVVDCVDNQDLQNCLCEFDKYTRYKYGEKGRVRKYQGV